MCEGQVQIIRFLLNEVYFDFNLKDSHGNSALDNAYQFNQQEIL